MLKFGPNPDSRASAREDAAGLPGRLALAFAEACEQPVVACDTGGNIVLANRAARILWALPEADAALTIADAAAWFGETAGPSALERVLAGQEVLSERAVVRSASGDERCGTVTARALRDDQGQMIGAVMTIAELASESASEQQLRNHVSDFEILTEASELLSEVSDAEEAAAITCTVAIGATGGMALLLWGLANGELNVRHHETAMGTIDLDQLTALIAPGAKRALGDRHTTIERLPDGDDGVDPQTVLGISPLTVWHEPLTSGGQLIGLLSIVWPGVLDDVDRPRGVIRPLAHHAATALERAELLRRLENAARTDVLTGLANRRVWHERLELEFERAQRDRQPLSVLLIDIDHFKSYNDRYGHPEGDRLLYDAAVAWSHRLREVDLLARIGGEEFAVLLPNCPSDFALRVADRLREVTPSGQTCSLGAVTWDWSASATELYEAGDAALYRAKRGGRNRAVLGELPAAREPVAPRTA